MFAFNDQQRTALAHRGGPLLIRAGAGTGKTGTLAGRVADLISSGVPPGRICLLTFTHRAAQEMLARAGHLTSPAAAAQVCGGTFHSVAHRVLRLSGRRVGLGVAFTVLDQADASEVMGLVRHDVLARSTRPGPPAGGVARAAGGRGPAPAAGGPAPAAGGRSGARFPRPDTLASIYSRVVCTAEPLAGVIERDFPWCREQTASIGTIFGEYTARKRARRLLDFEDLLLAWRAIGAQAGGAAFLAGLWDHVLVDEYQDTNLLQADILELLCPAGVGLTAVGDQAQAIYAFRAASARSLAAFEERFPGTTVVTLAENYRSIPPILQVANAVMAPDGDPGLWSSRIGRLRPVLRLCEDESAEAEAVCDSVLSHREDGVLLQHQAVLFRASHHADLLELALARRNIPYVKYGGLRVLEAAHVRDLLALLRVLDNPWDEVAWFRVLGLLEGVGPATARRVMDGLGLGEGAGSAEPGSDADPACTPLARLLAAPPSVPGAPPGAMAALVEALGDCADAGLPGGHTPAPAVQVERLSRWLEPVVRRRYRAPASRLEDFEQLARGAARHEDRGAFLAQLTLDPPAATSDLAGPPVLDEDWLVLSTVHSAKGGEWDVVHLIGAADGRFPADMACRDVEGIAEERRLLYVAVTRAREVLEINVPQRGHVFREAFRPGSDRHLYGLVSRFLTPAVRALMREVGGPGPAGDGELVAGEGPADVPGPLDEVDRFLSGLWA